jgi:hypothetical protein
MQKHWTTRHAPIVEGKEEEELSLLYVKVNVYFQVSAMIAICCRPNSSSTEIRRRTTHKAHTQMRNL